MLQHTSRRPGAIAVGDNREMFFQADEVGHDAVCYATNPDLVAISLRKTSTYCEAIRRAVNRRSNVWRHLRRSIVSRRLTTSTASSMVSTMNPVTPSSMISQTDPPGNAMTGRPQAMASIMTSPNGSGQSIGKSRAFASPRKAFLFLSEISPMNSTSGLSNSGAMLRSK